MTEPQPNIEPQLPAAQENASKEPHQDPQKDAATVNPPSAIGAKSFKVSKSIAIGVVALLVGTLAGWGGTYATLSPKLAQAQADYSQLQQDHSKQATMLQDTQKQLGDMSAKVGTLTQQNEDLTAKIKELTPNVDYSASIIEIQDITDGGISYGYRTIYMTIKNNSTTVLSDVFVDFSLEDASGNSKETGQAASNSVQLRPGATAKLQATVEGPASKGLKVVPASWTAFGQNGNSDSGNYDRSVKTLDLQ